MGKLGIQNNRFYLSHKLIVMVTLLILIASILVVLTNLSLNMIAASRDYTALLSKWSQLHYKAGIAIEQFGRTGTRSAYQEYGQLNHQRTQLKQSVDELFQKSIDADLIFVSLRSENVLANEISTLIFAFDRFNDWEIVQEIEQQWQQLQQFETDQRKLVEKLLQVGGSENYNQKIINQHLSEIRRINNRWDDHYEKLMAKVESASLAIKRIGLWISVILGILLVLIGVVVSVRAGKSIRRWEQSLYEKEILLSEIHHRVKNNLAVISGLLEMESMQTTNPEQALKESRNRIHSMAMIHEILYQSHSFSEINLDNYIGELSDYICETYVDGDKKIDLNTQLQEVTLNINQAVPAGLILNELLANTIEHGFEHKTQGSIMIHLNESDGRVQLLLKDNGKGLPPDFNLETANTTGFTIVKALVQQLDGELTIKNSEGPSMELQFSKSDASGSSNRYF